MTINLNQKIRKYRREPYFEGHAYHRIYRYDGDAIKFRFFEQTYRIR